jgi:ABC-type bacteriocin/lantibiotic exporter with double-glycine peptidase domain
MKGRKEARIRITAGAVVAGAVLVVVVAVALGRTEDPLRTAMARWHGARFHGIGDGVLQLRSNDCGPAALAHCLRRLGQPVRYPDFGRGIRLSRRGCTLEQLVEVALQWDWRAVRRRIEPADLAGVSPPAILYLRHGHFVAYEGRSADGRYVFHDPALGRLSYSFESLVRRWGGEILCGAHGTSAPTGQDLPARIGLDSEAPLVDSGPR